LWYLLHVGRLTHVDDATTFVTYVDIDDRGWQTIAKARAGQLANGRGLSNHID
jgi:hypothetical protein